ncbi:transcription antitermination protein NusB [Pasteurella multocida subsp. gallicida str. Anand1_poultry]|nr:transcription antitermination protein NusB [Pasteurella multocida subsp. gallicida str. Anand1_poultry]
MTEQKHEKKISPRRRARECAVQALYSWYVSQNSPAEIELNFMAEQDLKGVDTAYSVAFSAKPQKMSTQ